MIVYAVAFIIIVCLYGNIFRTTLSQQYVSLETNLIDSAFEELSWKPEDTLQLEVLNICLVYFYILSKYFNRLIREIWKIIAIHLKRFTQSQE